MLGSDIDRLTYEAYKAVKCHNNNLLSIDLHTLRLFLERCGFDRPILTGDLFAILTRFDRNLDSSISFDEF
jgi:hypothetical protein